MTPRAAALQLPWSILALYPVHFARILRQMERLADEAYDLATDAYVKDLAILLFRLVPFGQSSIDVHRGPTRRILTGDGPLQALRALGALCRLRGRGPVVVAHNHLLSLGERNERSFVTSAPPAGRPGCGEYPLEVCRRATAGWSIRLSSSSPLTTA